MPRATLIIDADTSAIRRAMGELPGLFRRAQGAMTSDARRGSGDRSQAVQRETSSTTSAARQIQRDRRAAEAMATTDAKNKSRERIAAARTESRERIALLRHSLANNNAVEAGMTSAAKLQSRARIATGQTESRERIAAAQSAARATTALSIAETRAHASAERARTSASRREVDARTRAVSAGRRAQQTQAAGAVRAAGAVAYRVAIEEHGNIQQARRTAAQTDSTIAGAVGLAGGDAGEAAQRAREMHAFAEANRLSSSDMAGAAATGQSEFNVLGQRGQTSAQRDAQFRAFMADYAEGANTMANPGEHVRLSGMLRAGGFDDATRQSALSTIGAATQAGSVEEGDLIHGGMAAMIARMRGARREGTETTQQAQLRELTAAVTEMEVAKSGGTSALRGGNILRGLTTTLRGPVVGDRILNNISRGGDTAGLTAAQRTALTSTMYEADPTRPGQQRLRTQYQSGVGLAEGFAAAGLSGQQLQNVLAGSGHGNAQGLGKPARDLLGSLMSQNAEGGTGLTAIRAMQNAGGISAADRTRMEGVRFGSDAAALLGQDEHAINERRSGLAAGVSDTAADFAALHPVVTGLATGFGDLAKSVGGWMGMRALLGYSATTATAGTAAAGTAATGSGLLSRLAGGALAIPAALGALLTLGGSYGGVSQEDVIGQRRAGEEYERQGNRLRGESAAANRAPPTAEEIGAAVAAAMRAAPMTISPADAAHAASAATPAPRR